MLGGKKTKFLPVVDIANMRLKLKRLCFGGILTLWKNVKRQFVIIPGASAEMVGHLRGNFWATVDL